MGKPFKKVLVANRGEIAIRVLRALKELSIPSVSVYSDADKYSPHIKFSDETYNIGEAEASKSYLNIEKIIEIAKIAEADAIHPGYGFLAENYQFSEACAKNNICFIGPSSVSIKLLGNKIESRKIMEKAQIPLIPGISSKLDADTLSKEARKIGLPILVKAASGGGGKGMRVVHKEDQLKDSIEAAQREAKSAFGDETIFIEKYLEEPRHIEFQIFGDSHGNIVHCFERECSIQRRHQKIIEETPSTALDDELRKRMGETAIKVAKVMNYVNAGTVEFLLDKNRNFYFLEVNTRIQVEHPVTELTLGIDLVKEQINVAQGNRLSFNQKDLTQKGHSIECRIYAEDPENNFLPAPGEILFLKEPQGPWIRVDSGIESGQIVPVYYDPILSKLIVYAPDRAGAIERMISALSNYIVLGIKTPIPFLKAVLGNKDFKSGKTYTSFIDKNMKDFKISERYKELLSNSLITLSVFKSEKKGYISNEVNMNQFNPWLTIGNFELLGK